jgi:hypothetical protein
VFSIKAREFFRERAYIFSVPGQACTGFVLGWLVQSPGLDWTFKSLRLRWAGQNFTSKKCFFFFFFDKHVITIFFFALICFFLNKPQIIFKNSEKL